VRPAAALWLALVMVTTALESRIAEVMMSALMPCDLGDGVEVVHEVETLEIELDCRMDDEADELASTASFERLSAPYERIEIQLDANAFIRATIEEAARASRFRQSRVRRGQGPWRRSAR
jgi:hypothetical protein